jgi:hypothetical protein
MQLSIALVLTMEAPLLLGASFLPSCFLPPFFPKSVPSDYRHVHFKEITFGFGVYLYWVFVLSLVHFCSQFSPFTVEPYLEKAACSFHSGGKSLGVIMPARSLCK